MGCGAVRRAQIVVYINEATPPYQPLIVNDSDPPSAFPPTGIVKRAEGIYFDDKELIKQCQAVHIDQISVFYADLITGLEVIYCLDQRIERRVHKMNADGECIKLELEEEESVNKVEYSGSDRGLSSITFSTNKGHQLKAEGSSGPGTTTGSHSFAESERAVVAFKGFYGQQLKSLGVYTWKLRRAR